MVKPRIETLTEKKLVGLRMRMTLAENKTSELWRSFMQRRKEITNNLNHEKISMQVYDPPFDVADFNLNTPFEKWATVEVADFNHVPNGMETFVLPGGLYAVFVHKGGPGTGPKTFQYIFGAWLPNSRYTLDDRPHFEVLGEKYKNDDPDSEEEIWTPIK